MVVHGRNWSHPSTKLSLRCYFGTNYLRGDITVIDGGDADWLNGLRCYAQLMIIAVTQVRVWLTFTCTFHSLCNVSTGKCGQFEFSWSSRSISPSDGATSCNDVNGAVWLTFHWRAGWVDWPYVIGGTRAQAANEQPAERTLVMNTSTTNLSWRWLKERGNFRAWCCVLAWQQQPVHSPLQVECGIHSRLIQTSTSTHSSRDLSLLWAKSGVVFHCDPSDISLWKPSTVTWRPTSDRCLNESEVKDANGEKMRPFHSVSSTWKIV